MQRLTDGEKFKPRELFWPLTPCLQMTSLENYTPSLYESPHLLVTPSNNPLHSYFKALKG